jgi:DNA mismatch repair protein MLH1
MTTIQALPQQIVDRIAAGEIVQRPASIVKELVENSLDSGATSIEVSAVKGGLESIQISDDGCGMTKDDLPLAAVRFATSKLRTFQDLKSIRTFGFRGEALASASMVSHLSILSKRAADSVAHKCQYSDGAALPNTLKPSAGGNGTTVKVDDLFYNVPSRKRSFKRDRCVRHYKLHYFAEFA